MFAVDHAATALMIKRRFPSASLTPLLLSVQAMELAWVGLNYLGVERTTTETSVRSVADIHLAYMPFSHSVATAVAGALLTWLLVEKGLSRPLVARAIGIGIVSHLVLDLVTHARDITLWPGSTLPALGLGLYDRAPMWGFGLEVAYGLVCWWVYRGSRPLLAMIILGNLSNITLFSAAIPGPEHYLAGKPLMVVTMVLVQIVATIVLIGVLARRRVPDPSAVRLSRPQNSRFKVIRDRLCFWRNMEWKRRRSTSLGRVERLKQLAGVRRIEANADVFDGEADLILKFARRPDGQLSGSLLNSAHRVFGVQQ